MPYTNDDLRKSLHHTHDFMVANNCAANPEWAHRTYEHLVLTEGQSFERKPLPRHARKMRAKMCYHNATYCVFGDPDRYRYVEGWAAGIIPMQHAFVLDLEDGKIFDPTWPRDENHTAYLGIVFPTDYVIDQMMTNDTYGIIVSDYMNGNILLRNGRSEWETP